MHLCHTHREHLLQKSFLCFLLQIRPRSSSTLPMSCRHIHKNIPTAPHLLHPEHRSRSPRLQSSLFPQSETVQFRMLPTLPLLSLPVQVLLSLRILLFLILQIQALLFLLPVFQPGSPRLRSVPEQYFLQRQELRWCYQVPSFRPEAWIQHVSSYFFLPGTCCQGCSPPVSAALSLTCPYLQVSLQDVYEKTICNARITAMHTMFLHLHLLHSIAFSPSY